MKIVFLSLLFISQNLFPATKPPALPPKPSNLKFATVTGAGFTVSWSSGRGTTAGFKIAISAFSNPNCQSGIDIGNKTNYIFKNLSPNQNYQLSVCAYNSVNGYSKPSTGTKATLEYIRMGLLESENVGATMWDEFTSNATAPEAVMGESTTADLRPWIGTTAGLPGVNAKQILKVKGLIYGRLYVLRLYPGYSSTSAVNWKIKPLTGNSSFFNMYGNEKTTSFPLGYLASGAAWNLTFIANTDEASFEFSGIQTSGENYLYLDAWELIALPTSIPANLFTLTSSSGPKLLGNSSSSTTRYSPKWKIRYNDYKFNCPKDLKLREERLSTLNKAIFFAYNRGASFTELENFYNFSVRLILGSEQIGIWIDESYDEIRDKWMACGGGYYNVAASYPYSKLSVGLKPASWWTSGGNYTGLTSGQSWWPSRQIYSINASLSYLMSNPTRTLFYQNVRTITAWEFGNQFGQSSGYFPGTTLNGEIGSKSPCGR